MYPIIAGVAQGLRYKLGQKEKQRDIQNRMALENLKNAMWNRRLQEETEQQRLYQQRLLEQYKANQEAALKKEEMNNALRMQQKADEQERFKTLKALEAQRLGIEQIRAKTESIKSGKEQQSKELSELLKIYDISQPERTKEGEKIAGTGNKIMARNILSQIQKYGTTKYGVPSGITGANLQDTAMNYFDQLVAGGIPPETAATMTQQRFASKGQKPTATKKESWKDYIQ